MTNAKGTRRSLNYNSTCIAAPATGSEIYIVPSEAFREQLGDLESDIQRRNVRGTHPSYSYDARAPRGVSPARNIPPTPNVAAEDMSGYARIRQYIPTITVIDDFEGTRHNDPQATRLDAFSHGYRTSTTVRTRCELTAYPMACKKLQ